MTQERKMAEQPPAEVLFELRRVGNAVKVSALDPVTNVEVCIVGSATAGVHALKMAALQKLRYVIAKQRQGG